MHFCVCPVIPQQCVKLLDLSHTAEKGCFKCHKSFPTESFGEKPDYSGFDRENWKDRTHNEVFEAGMKHKHAKTASEQSKLEKTLEFDTLLY